MWLIVTIFDGDHLETKASVETAAGAIKQFMFIGHFPHVKALTPHSGSTPEATLRWRVTGEDTGAK